MLKLVVLAVVATLCLSQDPGSDDYISCEDCHVPASEFPEEGEMTCFEIKQVFKDTIGKVWKCDPAVTCNSFDWLCVPQDEVCDWKTETIKIPSCELTRGNYTYKPIDQIVDTYQIYSPQFHNASNGYPNNTLCVWNVANTGLVTYYILNHQLQKPLNCDSPGCTCPDSVTITMGSKEVRLCGNDMPSMREELSFNGLHVKFCSDNGYSAKGFHLIAHRPTIIVEEKRDTESVSEAPSIAEVQPKVPKTIEATQKRQQSSTTDDECSSELDDMTCQYEYMMLASQPDAPCPDDATVKALLKYHNYLMSISSQKSGMCSGMSHLSSVMPMMNKIEQCAVECLYRTRDCELAEKLVDSSNGVLKDIARAIVENKLLKVPRWLNVTCTKNDN